MRPPHRDRGSRHCPAARVPPDLEPCPTLPPGAGDALDQAAADRAFADYLNARNQARRSRLAGGPDYLKAVRARVESEVAFDRLWRAAVADLRVRALRDGDRLA